MSMGGEKELAPAHLVDIWAPVLRRKFTGHEPRARPPWNQSDEVEPLLNRSGYEHVLDAMLHWRDPVERLRSLPQRRTLIDDNPCSG
jgi:hypothetical protein